VRRDCLMTALTGITLANPAHGNCHGTMLTLLAYTKHRERVPALAVWLVDAKPGNP
jgi:hypothetical protein